MSIDTHDISTFDVLYEHQGGCCAYCGISLPSRRRWGRGEKVASNSPTIDHVRPIMRSKRLKHQDRSLVHISNKVLACLLCNVRKRDTRWEPNIPPPTADDVKRCVESIRKRDKYNSIKR